MRPFQVGPDQFVETLFRRFQNVATLARRDARVIHQQIQAAVRGADVLDQRRPIMLARNVALKDIGAALGAQTLGGIAAAAIGRHHRVGPGEFQRNAAADATARAGHEGYRSSAHSYFAL